MKEKSKKREGGKRKYAKKKGNKYVRNITWFVKVQNPE